MIIDKLITQIHEWDIISDDLTEFDVQDCADYDEFFVFEDTLDEIMLAFLEIFKNIIFICIQCE